MKECTKEDIPTSINDRHYAKTLNAISVITSLNRDIIFILQVRKTKLKEISCSLVLSILGKVGDYFPLQCPKLTHGLLLPVWSCG